MTQFESRTTKENVRKFSDDVRRTGSYAYTAERLSAQIANARFTECIAESFDFRGKTVLDLGCGDGTYTLQFPSLGVTEVVGIDPADAAVDAANERARQNGLDGIVKFELGNIYALERHIQEKRFDCTVLRGVLHHLPDPARALACLSSIRGTIIVLEPNGNNPVLKLLEKYSRYHVEHEERSFPPSRIRAWVVDAGFEVRSVRVFNLVPMFCPDWMARALRFVTPLVERIPLLRDIFCGQSIIVGQSSTRG